MKKLYSLHKEAWILVSITALVIAVAVALPALLNMYQHLYSSTKEMVSVTCENESEQINSDFSSMEKSVRIMENYVFSFIEDSEDYTLADSRAEIIKRSDEMFLEVANNTEGAISYYLRFAPSFSDNTSGIFYTKTKNSDVFVKQPTTDLSLFPKDDVEHVGWYWQPYEKGEPIWMMPYYNRNIDVLMISFVIPMYHAGEFVGVVGMDFDYAVLTNEVSGIVIMKNGYAQLEKDGLIAYHKELEAGSEVPSSDGYIESSQKLKNGMTLTVKASKRDMQTEGNVILLKMLLMVAGALLAIIIVIGFFVRKFVSPLERLASSASKLAEGDYEIEVIHSRTKEVEELSAAFEDMAVKLREHNRLQNRLAYRDSLTGLRNTTSYKVWLDDFNAAFPDEVGDFAVVVLDINYLKETNDKYGHDAGNKLIISAANIISATFKRSPVFRIGGDEFLIVLQERDLEESDALLKAVEEGRDTQYIEYEGERVPVSIAKGIARYEPARDRGFKDVFNRADDAMYQDKRKMKGDG